MEALEQALEDKGLGALICPVCMCAFSQPVTLPCGHTLCCGCASRLPKQGADMRRQCPFDQRPLPPKKEWRSTWVLEDTLTDVQRLLLGVIR